MKIWHFLFAVMTVALILAIARDQIGQVALVVFFTTIGMMIAAVAAIMMLFRAIAAIGSAETTASYVEAIAATAGVVFFGVTSMLFVLWCGLGILFRVVGG